jgi:hypothetical protein
MKPVAQLPISTVNTTYSQPTGGTTWAAHDVTSLKNALGNSQPGDVIVMDAGVTYNGYFQLPLKSNPNHKWIYIISSGLANLPAGTRVGPTMTQYMAKVVTPNTAPAFKVAAGANYWRLAGIEMTAQSSYPSAICGTTGQPNCFAYFLMSTDWNPTAAVPDSIVIDRCYVHGSPTQDLQGGIQANWSHTALIDSYVSEIHAKGLDVNAIGAFHSPGPFKFSNNYLEAAGENVIFGGSGGNNNASTGVPSDITITGNYIFKPLSWVPLSLSGQMVVKNAIEIKSAQRVLIDSNVIENVWSQGQAGPAIVLTVRTGQSGDFAVVNDITITNNVLKNVVIGINTAATDDTCGPSSVGGAYPNCHNAGSQDRWDIANNLILFYDPTIPGGARNIAINMQPSIDRINNVRGVVRDVVFQHNTAVASPSAACWNSVYFGAAGQKLPLPNNRLTNNIWVLDNALCRQVSGDYVLQGTTGLTDYMDYPSTPPNDLTHRFYGNVMYVPSGDKVQIFPAGNLAQTAAFTYVNPSAYDYQLLTPYSTTTSDGQLSGVNNNYLPIGY